ncbi:MAG: tandem-95 repeat protein, partial [Deltaproteobacteria bacterium]|nr:tandem-95 repeat protein [Deltaproteobacteria bacterium]
TISDGNGGTDTATVTVTVSDLVNAAPDAIDDTATAAEDASAVTIDVLGNDTTEAGETLLVTSVTQPANGTVAITGGGAAVTFTPAANFNGTTTFTYTISDGNGGTDTATVSVTVGAVNDDPTATNDTATVAEDSTATTLDVLANDTTSPDGAESLTVTSVTQPTGGSVVIVPGGSAVTFQPDASFVGTATFTYTISDGNGGTATATVSVTVTGVNDAPDAVDDAATIATGSPATVIDVLANDSIAPDAGETLTVTAVTQPARGTVTIASGGTGVTYQPPTGFVGTATFTYTISDGSGGTDTATVSVTVSGTDTDNDKLSDEFEILIGTNPNDPDSDDDGVIDGDEPSPDVDSDGDGLINALDPDSDNDGLYDGTELGVSTPPTGTDVSQGHFIADADPSTGTDPLDADSDDGGVEDGGEDTNHDGEVDSGETDPNNAGDETVTDTDGDGLPDGVEVLLGSNPNDKDTDDDGVLDGDEANYQSDTDGDGLINVLDPDSDDDGLYDGTEVGVTTPSADTDVTKGHFTADADPSTDTSPLDPDSDNGGVNDGGEDTDRDGQVDPNEGNPLAGADDAAQVDSDGDGLPDLAELDAGTDPNDADSDDDGVIDGAEPNWADDSDGDGLINALDPDSDNDGLFDGTELGVTTPDADTDVGAGHFIADADPSTTTSPLDPDTDGGGVNDGAEDADHDGSVDPGERDPNEPSDDPGNVVPDADNDGIVDGTDNCQSTANPDQLDSDGDGRGDACDVCAAVANESTTDADADGTPDDCDVCPAVDNQTAPDNDEDGVPDDCDGDGFDDDVNGVSGGGCATGGASGSGVLMVLGVGLALALRRRRITCAAVTLVAVAAMPRLATAQAVESEKRNFSVERLRLASDRDGLIGVEWAEGRGDMAFDVALWVGYANDPLVVYTEMDGDRERIGSLVQNRTAASLAASLSPRPWLSLGFDLPLVLAQDRDTSQSNVAPMGLASLSSFGVGDLRLMPKITLLRQAKYGIGLAIVPAVILPTASSESNYLADRGAGFAPELVISRRWTGWRVGGNVGYHMRKRSELLDLVVDDELFALVSIGHRFADRGGPPIGIDLAFSGATAASNAFQKFNENHLEGLLGVDVRVAATTTVFAAGGIGLRDGFGTPDWRTLIGLRIGTADKPVRSAPPRELDTDRDGLLDGADRCPTDPEDKDDFEDGDGCPDPDNDKDGILDVADRCVLEPGIQELAGCPSQDEDSDHIADHLDTCPKEREDLDGFQDTDGCPELDNDQDTVVDASDACPLQAGPADNKGCPDPDRDGDTVVDRLDNCPDEPGDPKFAGCKTKQLVTITGTRLEILESVYFALDKAVILPRSFKLLNNIAAVLGAHPTIVVQIEGHTDAQGNDAYNKKLSQKRANSVKAYLVKRGVPQARLQAMGFGEDKPIAVNTTKEGRAQNRRVVFTILGGDGTVQTREQGAGEDSKEK